MDFFSLEFVCTYAFLFLGVTVAFDKKRCKELGLAMVCCGGKVFDPSSVCVNNSYWEGWLWWHESFTLGLEILNNIKKKKVIIFFFHKQILKLFPKHVSLCHVNRWHKSINFLFSHKKLMDALMRLCYVCIPHNSVLLAFHLTNVASMSKYYQLIVMF